jgi:hypothetical protein
MKKEVQGKQWGIDKQICVVDKANNQKYFSFILELTASLYHFSGLK